MQVNQHIKPKKALKYACLPGIVPRLERFARDGFGWLAHLMAVIFHMVRLLPPGHPYLNPANIGRFGMRHTIAEAYANISFKRENIDQVIIFLALVTGFILLLSQFILIVGWFAFKPAMAALSLTSPTNFFETQNPDLDIAFMLLDSVFGIPNMFESCVSQGTAPPAPSACGPDFPNRPFPSAFHTALHDLFHFYNLAILVIAVLIFLYYVIIMVAETASSGTPFGRRFAHIWAPLRLVVALGLLVPLNYGFNSAQYITLFAAKMGSGFATNGWTLYNDTLGSTGSGTANVMGLNDNASLIALPEMPDLTPLIYFMLAVKTCEYGYESSANYALLSLNIHPWLVKNPHLRENAIARTWDQARDFYNQDTITIVFGHANSNLYDKYKGGVYPYCGSITIPVQDVTLPGAREMQISYYNLIKTLWNSSEAHAFAHRAACIKGNWSEIANELPQKLKWKSNPLIPGADYGPYQGCAIINGGGPNFTIATDENGNPLPGGPVTSPDNQLPSNTWIKDFVATQQADMETQMAVAQNAMKSGLNYSLGADIAARGWGGAGIWYNNIARWNGGLFSAVHTMPQGAEVPMIMKQVRNEKLAHSENMTIETQYEPSLKEGQAINYKIDADHWIAGMMNDVYQYLLKSAELDSLTTSTGNAFLDTMREVFSFKGLFDLRRNDSESIHPLAQLAGLGKSLIDKTVYSLLGGMAFGGFGAYYQQMEQPGIANFLTGLNSIAMSVASVGLSAGFLLYYVIPFLPFIYFFFAVGAWVKSIFEAMVGVPLWALAHLRIDGNGLPGQTAMNGYFLIFDIFVRPILTIFGMLASIAIFSALAATLNSIFDFAVENTAGFTDACAGGACTNTNALSAAMDSFRTVIDQFFFTIVYAILLYMMALSSFKLIDQIPDGILRWMGGGVKTFSDTDGDVIGSFTQYAGFGAVGMSSKAINIAGETSGAVGGLTGALAKKIVPKAGGSISSGT